MKWSTVQAPVLSTRWGGHETTQTVRYGNERRAHTAWLSARTNGHTVDMLTILLAPLLPIVAIAFLLGTERLERGLDDPNRRPGRTSTFW